MEEGPDNICGDLYEFPAKALVLHHQMSRRAEEAESNGGVGAVLVRLLDVKLDKECSTLTAKCSVFAKVIVGDASCLVQAGNYTERLALFNSVGLIFAANSHQTRILIEVYTNIDGEQKKLGDYGLPIKNCRPRAGMLTGYQGVSHNAGRIQTEVVFVGQPTPRPKENLNPSKGEMSSNPLRWSDVKVRTDPRHNPRNESEILWVGDSKVTHSAIMEVHEDPIPTGPSGRFLPVGETTPECKEACNTGVGCYYLWEGKGRLGNVLQEIGHLWEFLSLTRYKKGVEYYPGYSLHVFEFPEFACLDKLEEFDLPNYTVKKVQRCPTFPNFGHEYDPMCHIRNTKEMVGVLRQFVVPHLSRALKTCLAKDRQIDEDKLLTIHLRGEDIFGQHVLAEDYENEPFQNWANTPRIAYQSPCGFMQKILSTKDFTRVLLVTSQDLLNPCVKWLGKNRNNLTNVHGETVEWELQTGNIVEDVCAIMKAQHFIISESSMSQNLMLYAAAALDVPRNIYGFHYQLHWMLGCGIPNAKLNLWQRRPDPISEHWPPGVAPLIDWLVSIGPEMFEKPRKC